MQLITLFNSRKSDTHLTLPCFLGTMNLGDAHLDSPHFCRTQILRNRCYSVLKNFKWIWATGYYSRWWWGIASDNYSKCTCNLPSISVWYLDNIVWRNDRWTAVKWNCLAIIALIFTWLYLAAWIFSAYDDSTIGASNIVVHHIMFSVIKKCERMHWNNHINTRNGNIQQISC